ncbi:unnamed protein product [Prorocentrum cordatum]|uniref:Uncharacterized protein n=1 Tax=Prorocentrum cordatum TaxID=2364126 RepID=A0ABN9UZZ8_9DINO|nr:unnamed protein product [Polarella glacialis]
MPRSAGTWALAAAAAGGPLQPPLADRCGPAVPGAGAPTSRRAYVGNLGALGADRRRGAAVFAGARAPCEGAGLAVHDRSEAPPAVGGLGVELDAERREARLTAARYWRLNAGLRWLLARRDVSTYMVEAFVGDCASVGLLVRQTISVLRAA